MSKLCPFFAPRGAEILSLKGQDSCPSHFLVKIKQYLIRRKAFTLLRGNSRDCKGFSYLREISCSVSLYQILPHLSCSIVRDSATNFDITGSLQVPRSLLPSASLLLRWLPSWCYRCRLGPGRERIQILCG